LNTGSTFVPPRSQTSFEAFKSLDLKAFCFSEILTIFSTGFKSIPERFEYH
jgi:hypothetical protein